MKTAVKGITLCCFLFLFKITMVNSQKAEYMAMIAFNNKIGFMADSAETTQNNLFPSIERSGLNYIVVIFNEPSKYSVNAIYLNGDMNVYQFSATTVQSELRKVAESVQDTAEIRDYKTAKLYFPEVAKFVTMSPDFHMEPYKAISFGERSNSVYFDIGISGTKILGAVPMPSFSMDGNIILKNLLLTLNFQLGKSGFSSELVKDTLDRKYKYSELGISAGYILHKDIFMFAVTGGIAAVKYTEEIYYTYYTQNGAYLGLGSIITAPFTAKKHIVELNEKKYAAIGFPVGFQFSVPSASGVGVSLKSNATFVVGYKPTYNIGIAIRLGRIYQ